MGSQVIFLAVSRALQNSTHQQQVNIEKNNSKPESPAEKAGREIIQGDREPKATKGHGKEHRTVVLALACEASIEFKVPNPHKRQKVNSRRLRVDRGKRNPGGAGPESVSVVQHSNKTVNVPPTNNKSHEPAPLSPGGLACPHVDTPVNRKCGTDLGKDGCGDCYPNDGDNG